ncbi:MAG: valine--tRNA ligase [Luteimonas sp.]
MTTLPPGYDPTQFETRLYAEWEASGVFAAHGDGPAYSILLPPPNVTGTLHMGHAFQHTLQDALVRYHRMRGFRTLWQMGSDHAGIATEMVVARNLAIEGNGETRDSLGREGFIEKVWEWKGQSGDTIERQMRRLGASGDWTRSMFTMDPIASNAVIEAFVRLHGQGLIYRGQKLVNWDPLLDTALSDLEVENREVPGHMWHFKYPLADGATYDYIEHDADGRVVLRETRDYIAIATTRPETMLGDGAVAVHPSDARYAAIVGTLCEIPVGPKALRRLIPIITDDYPDPAFGSGAVKITGAHDFNDYAVAARNRLPLYALLDGKARMRIDGLPYEDSARIAGEIARGERGGGDVGMVNLVPEALRGLDRLQARQCVIDAITCEGLAVSDAQGQPVVDAKPIMQPVGDRSGAVIEPMLTDQWFVNMAGFAKRGLALVQAADGAVAPIRLVPPSWTSTYRHWLNNIQDWCISRQLWWGHRIPAWYDAAGRVFVGRTEAEARATAGLADSVALTQDNDVLETWFSSALWPISTMGWPDADAMRERGFDHFVPSSVLVTGFDIIFFWVARMIMMTDHFTPHVPFKDVYITGLVRDKDGQKMSKSKGNVLDPLDLIDGIGLDALIAKRTTGLMKPTDAAKIEKATRKEFPDGIPAFGADALRFTMAALAGPGRDIKFDLERAEGYKNFCNKLWNAARFVLMNVGEASFPADAPLQPRTDAEQWILARLAATIREVDVQFAAYRFDLAAQALYEFTWNDYCDWFLEFAKPALQGGDVAAANSTRHTLLYVLERLLRLLHPLIPFITEEIWQNVAPKLGIASTSVSTQEWPAADSVVDAAAAADIEWLKAVVGAIRSVRGENGISPAASIRVLLDEGSAQDDARLRKFADALAFLAKASEVRGLGQGESPAFSAPVAIGAMTLSIPLEGLVDLQQEIARLDKEIKRLGAEVDKANAKLANANFVANAPAEVVAQEKERIARFGTEREQLSARRAKLG